MRVLDIIGFALIAGSLSSTIGERISSQEVNRASSHLVIFGFANTTTEEIEEFDRQLCELHGGPDAHDKHQKSLEIFQRCDNSLKFEIWQAVLEASDSPVDSIADLYYKEHCRRIPQFKNCMKNLTDSMKSCLDTSKHETADILSKVYNEVLEFICVASHVAEYMSAGFHYCMKTTLPALHGCANKTVVKYVRETVTDGAAIGGLGSLHFLVPDATKCGVIEKFQHCSVDALKKCNTSMAADAAVSLFSSVNAVTTCDKFLNSEASPARMVNILLMTVVTAMSLRFFN